jgi:two-component system alkaline phosphatase synthesis response regulator PhoP
MVSLPEAATKHARTGDQIMDNQKILVVDSDKGTAYYVCSCLEEFGYEALEAHDGETALQTIRCEKPDLVVLELQLPDRDGLEVTRIIRGDPGLFRLPIIILSGRETESDRLFGLGLGADDFVAKPFNPRELIARVQAVLRRTHRQYAGTQHMPSIQKEKEIRTEQ